ncbi:MAG TPA: universal stress protein [Gemmataceae bacterium]|nr:universal stress protein [Gemmataceae bacterium]
MPAVRTILHPTDFSEHSKYALWVASQLARDQGARLILMHVVPASEPGPTGIPASAVLVPERAEQEVKAYREEMRARLRQLAPDAKVAVEHRLEEGPVAKIILRTAEETPCDLVVMGTHGKSRGEQLMLGSVAEEVTRQATCPVIAVKMPSAAR